MSYYTVVKEIMEMFFYLLNGSSIFSRGNLDVLFTLIVKRAQRVEGEGEGVYFRGANDFDQFHFE